MGKRGPAPLPAALKKLRGTHQKCRDAPNALELPPGVPAPPESLDEDARALWLELCANEEWRVVLTGVDSSALELLVKHMTLERAYAKSALEEPFVLITTKMGSFTGPNPAARAARQEASIVRGMLQEFGLTPSSRSRVSTPGEATNKKKKDAAFLFGPMKAIEGGKK